MTKAQFLDGLRRALGDLSDKDIAASLDYYAEMIDERVEAGMDEVAAVAALGTPEAVAREILLEQPLPTVVKTVVQKQTRKHPWRVWEIILLALGSPIWLSILIALAAVLLSVYIVLWSVVASLWAVDISLAGAALGCLVAGVVAMGGGQVMSGLLYLGIVLLAAGLAVAGFIGCLALTVLFAKLSARFGRWIKSLFVGKERRDVAA